MKKLLAATLMALGSVHGTQADQSTVDLYLGLTQSEKELQVDEVQSFVDVFQSFDGDVIEDQIRKAYAEKLYFNDTLVTLTDREDLAGYMKETEERANYVRTTILDVARSGNDFYVRWLLEMEFDLLGSARASRTVGMSHLKFNEEGQIVLHQDFWDSASGLYELMPVVGGMIGIIKKRFQPENASSPEGVDGAFALEIDSSTGK